MIINSKQKDSSNKRKLADYQPIRIKIIKSENFDLYVNTKYKTLVNDSINDAVSYIEKLVSIIRLTSNITITQNDDQEELFTTYINKQYDVDLVIFFGIDLYLTDTDIADISIIRRITDKGSPHYLRPIITLLKFNARYLELYLQAASDKEKKKI